MINKIDSILTALKTRLRTAGIQSVLEFPEGLRHIGNKFPMAMIMLDGESNIGDQAGQLEVDCAISLYIVTQHGVNVLKQHNDVLYAAQNAIYLDTDLGGAACITYPSGLKWNSDIPGLPSTGLRDDLMITEITLNLKYINQRLN